MIKQTITYTDYNGVERIEDFYFNLNKVEILDMETSIDGGMSNRLKAVIEEKDPAKIMEVFKKIIAMAYGCKSADGKSFVKTPEATNAFLQSEAYVELFMKLASDAELASTFMNGVIPKIN